MESSTNATISKEELKEQKKEATRLRRYAKRKLDRKLIKEGKKPKTVGYLNEKERLRKKSQKEYDPKRKKPRIEGGSLFNALAEAAGVAFGAAVKGKVNESSATSTHTAGAAPKQIEAEIQDKYVVGVNNGEVKVVPNSKLLVKDSDREAAAALAALAATPNKKGEAAPTSEVEVIEITGVRGGRVDFTTCCFAEFGRHVKHMAKNFVIESEIIENCAEYKHNLRVNHGKPTSASFKAAVAETVKIFPLDSRGFHIWGQVSAPDMNALLTPTKFLSDSVIDYYGVLCLEQGWSRKLQLMDGWIPSWIYQTHFMTLLLGKDGNSYSYNNVVSFGENVPGKQCLWTTGRRTQSGQT